MPRIKRLPSTPLAPALLALLVTVGCASGGAAASPGASAAASAAPSLVVSPGGGPVADAEQAAALVIAQNPAFAGIVAKDPDLIGQGSWYEVTPIDGGWQVLVEIGWGDCQSGCIDRHNWTYVVSPEGRVGLIRDEGPPVPSEDAIDY